MSALGQKRTYAVQKGMSALPPIATAKANFRKGPYPLCPRKRTCAVQSPMSAMGQKKTCAAHGSCPPRAKGQKSFQGLLVLQIGHWRSRYRVFDHRGGRRGL